MTSSDSSARVQRGQFSHPPTPRRQDAAFPLAARREQESDEVVIRHLYPCLCLCRGFVQRIRTTPRRLTTLHFAQIGFTDDLTFIMTFKLLLEAIRNPPPGQIVGRHFYCHFVPRKNANKMHAHFPRDMRENFMTVI